MEILYYPLRTFRVGTWECEVFLPCPPPPTAAYRTTPCTGDCQGRIVTSVIYIPARELCPASLTSLEEDKGIMDSP